MPAVDSAGFPTRPVANELIESAWGSAVRDRTIVAAGAEAWHDLAPLNNGPATLLIVNIPTQAIDTILHTATSFGSASQGTAGGSFTGSTRYLGGTFNAPLVGPFDLSTFAGYYRFASEFIKVAIPAGTSPTYEVRVNPGSNSGLSLVQMSTSYLLVVDP